MAKKRQGRSSAWIDFSLLKRQVSIEQVLEHYDLLDDLKPKDDGYTGDCPFHEGESRRPFHVSLSKGAWFCFGCEEGGNVLDFVMLMEDCTIKPAAASLAEWFNIKPTRRPPKKRKKRQESTPDTPVADSPALEAETSRVSDDLDQGEAAAVPPESEDSAVSEEKVNKPLGFVLKNLDPGHELLKPLGFDRATVERFGAGLCGKGMMAGRLAVPVHDLVGNVLAYAGLSLGSDQGWKYPPGFTKTFELYNLHRAYEEPLAADEGLIIVDDILNVWRLAEAGIPNAVALMGSTPSKEQLDALIFLTAGSGNIILTQVVDRLAIAQAIRAREREPVFTNLACLQVPRQVA